MAARRKPVEEQTPRRRLSVDERRAELLRIGMRLFSTRAYEEIRIEEIAELAGISRGLLYHYFPTKRDFYVAVSRSAAAEAGELTAPEPSLPPSERLRAGIDAFVRYAEEHSQGFLTAYRGSLAGDAEVRGIVEEGRQRQVTRILETVAGDAESPPLMRLAVHGWIALAQNIIARWLQERDAAREDVCELLNRALSEVIAAAMEGGAHLHLLGQRPGPRRPQPGSGRRLPAS
jgi:AcrR family transcriptional regulator